MSPKEVKSSIPLYKLSKNPDYFTIHSSGMFGSLNANEGILIFFIDRPEPKLDLEGDSIGMSLDYVNRELLAEINMSYTQFISVHKWMGRQIKVHQEAIEKGDA